MKKSTVFSLAAVLGSMIAGAETLQAQTMMEPATLDYPSGYYASFPPSSVSLSYDNQPISLVDPHLNDFDEECVTVYVRLGEGERQPVSAAVLYSFGNPEDPDDSDIWNLDIALYELDDLWEFTGETLTVIVPEGVVENGEGAINPAQDLVFHMMPACTDYTISPESGETLEDDLTIKISFGGNPVEYLQSEVRLMTYEPEYRDISLALGKEVSISDNNEIVIDLSGFESGEYELVVPEGFVKVTQDGSEFLSPDLWLEYTLVNNGGESGVSSIEENGASEVFTIHGLRVKVSPDGSLPAGIYIVNGKKVVKASSF